MQCLLSAFNFLSWLGFRDCLIRRLAFFPPPVTHPLATHYQASSPLLEMPLLDASSSLVQREESSMKSEISFNELPLIQQEIHVFPLRNGGKSYGVLYRNLNIAQNYHNLLLFSHGNATNVEQMHNFFLSLTLRLQVDVFAYEYTGYSGDGGSTSEESILFDVEGAYRFVRRELGYAPEKIILYGQSLGSVPTLYLASNPYFPVKGVVLHSPIASGLRILCPNLQQTPSNDFFANIELMPFLSCPLLIIHGEQDDVVPISHSRFLMGKAKTLMMVWWVEGCGHEDIVAVKGMEFFKNIRKFLRILGKRQSFRGGRRIEEEEKGEFYARFLKERGFFEGLEEDLRKT